MIPNFVHPSSNMIELKRSVSRWTRLYKMISPIIWRKQNTFDTQWIGGSFSIRVITLDHWEIVLTSTKVDIKPSTPKIWSHSGSIDDGTVNRVFASSWWQWSDSWWSSYQFKESRSMRMHAKWHDRTVKPVVCRLWIHLFSFHLSYLLALLVVENQPAHFRWGNWHTSKDGAVELGILTQMLRSEFTSSQHLVNSNITESIAKKRRTWEEIPVLCVSTLCWHFPILSNNSSALWMLEAPTIWTRWLDLDWFHVTKTSRKGDMWCFVRPWIQCTLTIRRDEKGLQCTQLENTQRSFWTTLLPSMCTEKVVVRKAEVELYNETFQSPLASRNGTEAELDHSTDPSTRFVRRNNECARVWHTARTLARGMLPCGSVAIKLKSRCLCPEHDVILPFVVCRFKISYVWCRQSLSSCKLCALRRWPWISCLNWKSDCVSFGFHRDFSGMDKSCSGKTSTRTQNIVTVELKLPWCETSVRGLLFHQNAKNTIYTIMLKCKQEVQVDFDWHTSLDYTFYLAMKTTESCVKRNFESKWCFLEWRRVHLAFLRLVVRDQSECYSLVWFFSTADIEVILFSDFASNGNASASGGGVSFQKLKTRNASTSLQWQLGSNVFSFLLEQWSWLAWAVIEIMMCKKVLCAAETSRTLLCEGQFHQKHMWSNRCPVGVDKPDDPDAKIKFFAAEALRGVGGLVFDARNEPPFCLALN